MARSGQALRLSPGWLTAPAVGYLVVFLAPLLTNAVVRTFGWMIILGGPKGLINALLLHLGLVREPVKILYTMNGVLIGLTQIELPFMILPIIATLEGQDRRLLEAAS